MQSDKAIAAFLTNRQARNLRPKTLEYYGWCLSYLDLDRPLPIAPIEIELILREASMRLSPVSLHDLWRGLRTVFRWLESRYPCEAVNPFERASPYGRPTLLVQPPSVQPRIRQTLTCQQLHTLLTVGCISRRDRALVLIILDTGIRLSEVASIIAK